jgi:hypothetical protein
MGDSMDYQRPYLICCGILQKEVEKLIEDSQLPVEPLFLEAGLHVDYSELGKQLKQAIKGCSKDSSRRIIVVYGDLCHPKMKEITSKYDNVVKVDALNCIDCLLGGHGKLLEVDPNYDYFYLSPGWMPSNLKANPRFRPIFYGTSTEEIRKQFSKLKGILLFDSLKDLGEFNDEIEEFSNYTGLPILGKKVVGLDRLKDFILETIKRPKNVHM